MEDKILKLVDGEVHLVDDLLELIPELATLHSLKYNKQPGDTDGRKRVRVKKELIYTWFMYSKNSPYREYGEAEQKAESLETAKLPADYEFSTEYALFLKKYNKCNTSRILRLIKGAEIGIDKLTEYFTQIDFTTTSDNGTLKNKPTDFINTVSKLSHVSDGLRALEIRLKTENKEFISTRGDQEAGWIMERDNNAYNSDGDSTAEDS